MTGLELILACSLHVAPQTMAAIIRVESNDNVLAVHVNGADLDRPPATVEEAVAVARYAVAQGYSVDLGLMQVNSRNLAHLGYALEQMFDPCLNIKAGSEILLTDYAAAVHVYGEGQTALRAALSAYNSGSFERGFRNGYVARYYARAQNAPAHRSAIPDRRPNEVNPYQADIGIFNVKETANASE